MSPDLMPPGPTRRRLLAAAGGFMVGGAGAPPPAPRLARLRRGINVTGWFRFPVSRDPAALRSYLGSRAIAGLRAAGFDFVRLAVDPALLDLPPVRPVLAEAVRRLSDHDLAVVVSLHPQGWRLEEREADRASLHRAWHLLAPLLRPFDPRLVCPEVLNEPVFPGDPVGWQRLQCAVLATIRSHLPAHTVVLTGHDWSSIAGLETLMPVPDANTVGTFHFYEPAELTSLAAWRPDADRTALARLPFPVMAASGCLAGEMGTDPPTAGMIAYYCSQGWDAARIGVRIAAAAAWGRRAGVPVLCGEFGATRALNAPARLAWLRAVRAACEADGIGWALWGYDDVMGLDVPRPPGGVPRLDALTLRALGLPG